MNTIGGADNFCLQKSRMPLGRIGIFIYAFMCMQWLLQIDLEHWLTDAH